MIVGADRSERGGRADQFVPLPRETESTLAKVVLRREAIGRLQSDSRSQVFDAELQYYQSGIEVPS